MGRNRKGDRFLLNRTNLERAFSRPNPKFDEAWMLLYLYITGSDRLSRRNILNSEEFAYKLRQIPEWQNDPLNLDRMERIDAALLRAKDRWANRKTRKEKQQEKATRKEERAKKAKNEPQAPLTSTADAIPTAHLWLPVVSKEKENANA
jgi:hypothetical protein